MGFWKRQPQDEAALVELSPLDRATKALAIGASRRSFLKKLSIGAGVAGASMFMTAKPAAAASCCGIVFSCPGTTEDCIPCSTGKQTRFRTYSSYCNSNCSYGCNVSTTYAQCGSCVS